MRVVGFYVLSLIKKIGLFSNFSLKNIFSIRIKNFYFKSFFQKLFSIGFLSIPVSGMTAFFTGAVLALQGYSGFSRLNAESSIPIVVVLSITRELAPVLTALMFVSRVGSSIAANVGTMQVTEQIDALKTLSVSPRKYIIIPYLLAGLISLPILTLISDLMGVLGGYIVSTKYLGFSSAVYIKSTMSFLTFFDVFSGVIKAFIFAFFIVSISTFNGYFAKSGAEGVGKAVVNSVVTSSIAVFILNYIITAILF